MKNYKLVLFDMDGTLLKEKGIFVIAEKKGFINELKAYFENKTMPYYKKSMEIAKLLKGFEKKEFLDIFRSVPLQDNADFIIKELKKNNIKVAIATDSYQFLVDDLKNRIGADYAFGNNLVTNDGIITGELLFNNFDLKKDYGSDRIYSICKSDVLEKLCKELKISLKESIAIGDGIVDIGMIKKAGLGIAFKAREEVNKNADVVTNDLMTILNYI